MKPLIWLGSSHNAISNFSNEGRREAGFQLSRVQEGLEPRDWSSMSSVGAGVMEIRIHAEKEYRVLYVAKFAEAVYVLHAFGKKTHQTSPVDIEYARVKFRQLIATRKSP